MHPIAEIYDVFRRNGNYRCAPNSVTYAEHALQAAALAESELASTNLVVAALLHDVGHFLDQPKARLLGRAQLNRRERLGKWWLSRFFGSDVTEPVRQHVAAKRYLSTVRKGYVAKLSPWSLMELHAQGGPMTRYEADQFERNPFFVDALWLCRIDEESKVAGRRTPNIEHYRGYLEDATLEVMA